MFILRVHGIRTDKTFGMPFWNMSEYKLMSNIILFTVLRNYVESATLLPSFTNDFALCNRVI